MSIGSWCPCGIVTLTTDFGQRDPFVGVMKGRILDWFPNVRIVDLTHEIQPFWPMEAGFWLSRAAHYFPPGSVHVAVVDPGVGSDRNSLIMRTNDQAFVAPDNGLLSAVWERYRQEVKVWRVDLDRVKKLGLGALSATFHGRDLYAPLAALLAAGKHAPSELGAITEDFVVTTAAAVGTARGVVRGNVMTIDHFGNALTNIDAEIVKEFHSVVVLIEGISLPMKRTYSDAAAGDLIAVVNSFGVLEIAQVQGNAALALGLRRGSTVEVQTDSSTDASR